MSLCPGGSEGHGFTAVISYHKQLRRRETEVNPKRTQHFLNSSDLRMRVDPESFF